MNDVQYISLGPRAKDLTGERFHRLIVLGPVGRTTGSKILWRCRCDCGNEVKVQGSNLYSGNTQSCGCFHKEVFGNITRTHGFTGSNIYKIYRSMIQRCTDPNSRHYPNYGGRGIAVCDEWRHDFQAFYDYVSQLPRFGEGGMTLDRMDNSLGYQPGNVRWATWKEQQRNRTNNHLFTLNGEIRCVAAWAEEYNISQRAVWRRVGSGWSMERALTTPLGKALSKKGSSNG